MHLYNQLVLYNLINLIMWNDLLLFLYGIDLCEFKFTRQFQEEALITQIENHLLV